MRILPYNEKEAINMITDDEKDKGIKISVSIDGGVEREIKAFGSEIYIGAGEDNNIRLCDSRRTVSRRHIRLIIMDRRIYVEDLGSKNGTFIGDRGNRIPPKKIIKVDVSEIIYIGPNVRVRIEQLMGYECEGIVRTNLATSIKEKIDRKTGEVLKKRRHLEIPSDRSVVIGRSSDCDYIIDHPQVSRHHARITLQLDGILVEDLGSKNGTFVNGRRINRDLMDEGDILGIGPVTFSIGPKMETIIEEALPGEGMRIDGKDLTRYIKSVGCILQETYLTVKPGEFMGILGASGSGKTTLLSLLNGSIMPTNGSVWFNDMELYPHYNYLKKQMGYVPQHDIIHTELSVGEILYYSAKLRQVEDPSRDYIEELIMKTLRTVGLSNEIYTDFKELSGGEKKKVNMAVELVTDPQVFFLDEPTSGLDPASEKDVMELFEEYSHREKKTVVMVTHVTQNVSMMDKLIILETEKGNDVKKGGRTAFFGTPEESLDFFNVGDFIEIYEKIEESSNWNSKYLSSEYAKKYSYIYQKVKEEEKIETEGIRREEKGIFRRLGDWFSQLFLLTSRYSKIMVKDTRNILTLLLQAPVIGILTYFAFKGAHKIGQFPPEEVIMEQLLFVLIIAAIWFGANNSAREISKEQSVYRRERMVFLKIFPYLFSKFIVLAFICLFQTVILVLMMDGLIGLKGNIVDIMLIVFLTALSGVTLGLFISSVVKTTNMAISLIPIVLIPQIIFSGLLKPVEEMDDVSKAISKVCVSYWSYSLINEITVGKKVESNKPIPTELSKMNLAEKLDLGGNYSNDEIVKMMRKMCSDRQRTYEKFKPNLSIIGIFILIPFIMAYIAILSKERKGFENR